VKNAETAGKKNSGSTKPEMRVVLTKQTKEKTGTGRHEARTGSRKRRKKVSPGGGKRGCERETKKKRGRG